MKTPQWTAYPVVPGDIAPPSPFPKNEGEYLYRDKENNFLGYTLRMVRNGKKVVLPFTYCHAPNQKDSWRFKRWEEPLPLYNLDKISPKSSIIIVEGEKCADALASICPENCIAVCWVGGANAIKQVDWTPLYEHKVLLWPDHDLPGYKAMSKIARKLSGHCDVKILKPPQEKPPKWDVADAILEDKWKQQKIFSYIKENIITENKLSDIIEKLETPENLPTTTNDAPFVFLGFNHGEYYYHPKDTEQITCLTAPEHSANHLFRLAPKEYWNTHFASKTGIDWKSAVDWLIQQSHLHGVYDVMRVRGCGVWIDKDRVVVHNGQSLVVDNKKTTLSEIKSNMIYEREIKKDLIDSEPLSFEDYQKVLEICHSLVWDNKLSSYLLAGWTVLAPICGALTWRPHIYMTGSAGAGKTYVVDHIIKPLLGDVALYTTVGTTAAGILQNLKSSAFPVLVDEAESKTKKSSQVIQSILDLMRQASSDSEARTLKGTADGSGIQYCIRSCFCLASIGVSVDEEADKGRISILSLRKDNRKDKSERFKTLHEKIILTLKHNYCNAFRARSILNLKTILKNISTFTEIAAIKLGNQRQGDQIGALLGAAYVMISEKPVSVNEAQTFMDSWNWDDFENIENESDESQCYQTILQHQITVNTPTKRFDTSVSEIIQTILKDSIDFGEDAPPISIKEFDLILRRNGIRVDKNKKMVFISNSNNLLKKMFWGTRWAKNWSVSLLRIPRAKQISSMRFAPGIINRSVGLPLN